MEAAIWRKTMEFEGFDKFRSYLSRRKMHRKGAKRHNYRAMHLRFPEADLIILLAALVEAVALSLAKNLYLED